MKHEGEKGMNQKEQDFVFGLDIGTRNVVGTVGKLQDDGFHVIAQCTREHETRAMILKLLEKSP